MKLQHFAIIFIIIILPISLIMGEYIGSQIDTIYLQTQYSKRLQDSTLDAVKAFQLNTLNNKYSSISDSKIRDIEASINTFYNSLSSAMGSNGLNEDALKEYIPAMIYTLYDGYYIYGQYYNYENQSYQYGLKPYIYYACRYKTTGTGIDIVINYTLDNSITVYGNVNGEYITKSGYVINPDLVGDVSETVTIDKNLYPHLTENVEYPIKVTYGKGEKQITIEKEILEEQLVTEDDAIEKGNEQPVLYQYTQFNNQKIYKEPREARYFTYYKGKKEYLSDEGKVIQNGEVTPLMYAKVMTEGGNLYSNSAVEYYVKAKEFSTWLSNNLGTITENDAYDNSGEVKFATTTENDAIFKFNNNNNPLLDSSTFNEHRMNVIRRSIETNLRTAIAGFNIGKSLSSYEFIMPKLSEDDWYKLLNNISVSVFMQGIPMKTKTFNSYCVITNNKNREVVTKQSIYMIAKNKNGNLEVHLPGCTDLVDGIMHNTYDTDGSMQGYNTASFQLQTVVLSDEITRYYYPHKDPKCYNCIVSSSKNYNIDSIIEGTLENFDKEKDEYTKDFSANIKKIRTKYLTALARERYDLYRTNASFGIED